MNFSARGHPPLGVEDFMRASDNNLRHFLESIDNNYKQVEELKVHLLKAKSMLNKKILEMLARGVPPMSVANESSRQWSEIIAVFKQMYSPNTVRTACQTLNLESF